VEDQVTHAPAGQCGRLPTARIVQLLGECQQRTVSGSEHIDGVHCFVLPNRRDDVCRIVRGGITVLPVRIRITLASVLVALCSAGCASAVHGQGRLNVSSRTHHDFPSMSSAIPSPLPDPSSTPSSTPRTTAPLTRAARVQALVAQTNGEANNVVAVPGGYEAATWDQYGDIQFWYDAPDTVQWRQVGQSRYPYVPALGPPHARVTGAALAGMQHATFIVRGVFTGDGSGNAVAFTDGPNGWGAIKAEPDGNIGPSGAPVGRNQIGLSYNFAFSSGDLITQDCPSNRPVYQCGRYAITKRWAWNGTDFSLAR
jgi:hypothetical protein